MASRSVRWTTCFGRDSLARERSLRFDREQARQLAPRSHPELAVGVAEVRLDRLLTEEEVGGNFFVCQATRHRQADLQLLWCEVAPNRRGFAMEAFAGRGELLLGPANPRSRAQLEEDLEEIGRASCRERV